MNIIFIVGPTGVGKSAVALELSKRVNGEIVSCDAMQVYDQVKIASNCPTPEEEKLIPHHLVGCVPIQEEFDVSRFYKMALSSIEIIIQKGKIPLVCGGSGMYMQVLLDGIFDSTAKDEVLRQQLFKQAQEKGPEYLHKMLMAKDPASAAKIHANDQKRLVRALEVFHKEQRPISELNKQRQGLWGKYNIWIYGLRMERDLLYGRINTRVDQMISQGLVEEIKALDKVVLSKTAEKIIGISEIRSYLSGEKTLEQAVELIKQNTRRYAKRQMTWFRKESRIEWIDLSPDFKPSDIADKIFSLCIL
ncbi:MAG: tRNA (adenosine(37)-N6)-dimethylallyltransferase MiaA [Candidatus Omnitrophica bacterium]|nr:tRNA (adenosine(37)-N6)-dimethylallyltransferase MiaA [Candidatus Omnitrophota bacterium]